MDTRHVIRQFLVRSAAGETRAIEAVKDPRLGTIGYVPADLAHELNAH